MNRGEIWLVSGGVYASKPRPAVLLQDDRFGGTESVTVCPFTSTDAAAPLLRMALAADDVNGLDSDSYVMVDKITTVRRTNVVRQIGSLSPSQLTDLQRLIMAFLGLAD